MKKIDKSSENVLKFQKMLYMFLHLCKNGP